LFGAVAKPASINLQKWFLSPTSLIKPWFHTERNLPLCSSYLPLGVPNWVASTANHCTQDAVLLFVHFVHNFCSMLPVFILVEPLIDL
jgi:hypothetical protein